VSDTVIKQIDILKNIANEFSNYARMPDLKLEKINLYDVMIQVSNLFIDKQIEIVLKFYEREYIVYADGEQLQRTLVNLVRNSMQASADRIEFNIELENNSLICIITDNGQGIPMSIKDRIFDADFTTKIEGMGLGLHMAKRFLESIDAKIELKDTSSKGTSIMITFPVIVS
jgi:nitrogen fixation/metabolism regulation signal transduction histidine kinase